MWGRRKDPEAVPPSDNDAHSFLADDMPPDFNADDLENDPSLLAELAGLSSGVDHSPAPRIPASRVTVNSVKDDSVATGFATGLGEIDMDAVASNIQLTDADLNDPDLLRELGALSIGAAEIAVIPPELSTAPAPRQAAPTIPLNDLKIRQLEYKQLALAFKKRGDGPKAREMLLVAKSMQVAIDLAEAGSPIPASFRLPAPPPSLPPVSEAVPSYSAPPTTTAPIAATAPRQAAAVATATVHATVKAQRSPQTVAPQMPKVQVISSPPIPANTRPLLEQVIASLESQVSQCTSIAHYSLKNGKKDVALVYHKLKKQYVDDIKILNSIIESLNASSASQKPVFPTFKYEPVRYEVETTNSDLGAEDVEVTVVRAYEITPPRGSGVSSSDLQLYVAFDLGLGSGDEGKGQTAVVSKTTDPEFNSSKKCKVFARENGRTLVRTVERKRAFFDVFHQVQGWLFAGKPVHIGRASIPLSDLLSKCEIHEVVNLVDPINPRKTTGGKLEIQIRVRVPLLKPAVSVKEERWVSVDFSGQLTAAPVANPSPPVIESPQDGSTQPIGKPSEIVVEETIVAPKNDSEESKLTHEIVETIPVQSQTPRSETTSTSATTPAADSEGVDIEEVEMQFLNPDLIASNNVLETEHTALLAQISALKAAKRPVPDDLMDKKNGYEFRLNILVTMVQTGALTIADYITSVKSCIAKTKIQALAFKKAGKLDLAKQALSRLKIMNEEVQEVETAIANGEM
ncbi:Coiled-coil and C2 domain-containing protein 1B [Entophlyctis sp. JEL0112]|nr:Coiled-coil and C2 domain-containing protein 1B [Entophlyctis sp. JEL0112]